MIVTTNFNLKELEERIGERIISRMAGMCVQVEMQNRDYRIENAPRLRSENSI
jgi:DNA replication protein DnaC